jgi:hypothetical protein
MKAEGRAGVSFQGVCLRRVAVASWRCSRC